MTTREFRTNIDLAKSGERLTRGAQAGVRRAAEYLLTEANKHVPHDEGTLERSGHAGALPVASNKERVGYVTYETPYAVMQHETLGLVHDGKGEAKWLENTFTREAKNVGEIVAATMREASGA